MRRRARTPRLPFACGGQRLRCRPLDGAVYGPLDAWRRSGPLNTQRLFERREKEAPGMAYKPFDLTGKVALVTGGNSGIGLGMADAMAQAGADIVIWGTNPAKNQTAEGKLNQHGVRVLAQQVNVGDEAAVVAAM